MCFIKLRGFNDKCIQLCKYKYILDKWTKVNTKCRKAVLTYRLHTLKDKPSSVNKETKI